MMLRLDRRLETQDTPDVYFHSSRFLPDIARGTDINTLSKFGLLLSISFKSDWIYNGGLPMLS